MPTWVSKLARNYLTNPVTVDLVGDNRVKIADTLKVLSINVPAAARKSVLVDLLTVYGRGAKAIVFTQTKREADEVNAVCIIRTTVLSVVIFFYGWSSGSHFASFCSHSIPIFGPEFAYIWPISGSDLAHLRFLSGAGQGAAVRGPAR